MKRKIIILLVLILSLSGCNNGKIEESNLSNRAIINEIDKIGTNEIVDTNEMVNSTEDILLMSDDSPTNEDKTEDYVIVYQGISLLYVDREIDIFEDDLSKKEEITNKYEREYYLYADGKLLGKGTGKLKPRGLDYYWIVEFDNSHEVAITKDFNPYPREITKVDSNIPAQFADNGKIVTDINNDFGVDCRIEEIYSVDLDGDGKNEYLTFAVDETNYFFAKCLISSDFKIISYLTAFKEVTEVFNELVNELSIMKSSEIIDIDNDNIMEIIVEQPTYEGFLFDVFVYKNGIFFGEFLNYETLKPWCGKLNIYLDCILRYLITDTKGR